MNEELDYVPLLDTSKYDLTTEELKAASLIISRDMSPKGKRKTYPAIAEELGVSRKTLWIMRSKSEFQRYVRDAAVAYSHSKVAMAVSRLEELADGTITGTPSIKAISMILEMSGVYNQKQTIEHVEGTSERVSDEDIQRIIDKLK